MQGNTTDRAKRCPDCLGSGVIFLYREGWDGDHPAEVHYACVMCDATGYIDARLPALLAERYGDRAAMAVTS